MRQARSLTPQPGSPQPPTPLQESSPVNQIYLIHPQSTTPQLATLACPAGAADKRRLVLIGSVRSTGSFEFSGTTSNQKHQGQCSVLEEVEPSAFPIDNSLNVSVLQFQCKC